MLHIFHHEEAQNSTVNMATMMTNKKASEAAIFHIRGGLVAL
jgi:hypothetical protein